MSLSCDFDNGGRYATAAGCCVCDLCIGEFTEYSHL